MDRNPGMGAALIAVLLLPVPRPAEAQTCTRIDADCDGIQDGIERTLLATYRPELRFSRDNGDNETFRPIDVASYLATAEVDGTGSEGEKVVLSRERLANDVGQLIGLSVEGRSSSLVSNAARTIFFYAFYAHGKEMAFDLASRTEEVLMDNNTVKEVRGSQYNQPVPALDAEGRKRRPATTFCACASTPRRAHLPTRSSSSSTAATSSGRAPSGTSPTPRSTAATTRRTPTSRRRPPIWARWSTP
jgi:hypothetical protein